MHLLGTERPADDLLRAAALAQRMCEAVREKLGTHFTLSAGVARNKLVSNLASSANKPNGVSCVADSFAVELVRATAVSAVPGFKGKLGHKICSDLDGITTVQDLSRYEPHEISRRLGNPTAERIRKLLEAECDDPVEDRPGKTVLVER